MILVNPIRIMREENYFCFEVGYETDIIRETNDELFIRKTNKKLKVNYQRYGTDGRMSPHGVRLKVYFNNEWQEVPVDKETGRITLRDDLADFGAAKSSKKIIDSIGALAIYTKDIATDLHYAKITGDEANEKLHAMLDKFNDLSNEEVEKYANKARELRKSK